MTTPARSHPISPRRKERILVLQALFMMDVGGASLSEALSNVRTLDMGEDGWAYVDRTTRGIVGELEEIDEAIRAHLQHWSWDRLARVDRNLLRIGSWEMIHSTDLPFHVFISEAVDLAKEYSDEGSSGFINGVLDAIWHARSPLRGASGGANEGPPSKGVALDGPSKGVSEGHPLKGAAAGSGGVAGSPSE